MSLGPGFADYLIPRAKQALAEAQVVVGYQTYIDLVRPWLTTQEVVATAMKAEVQRCQIHKRRNVKEHLPKSAQGDTDRRIRNAYAMTGYAEAKAELG